MLTQITLDRFKCFNRLYMPLKPLTLIAGVNGAGKSSIIQALLLLVQSCKDKDHDWKNELVINGDLTDLDNARFLLYNSTELENATVGITVENDNESEIVFSIIPKQIDTVAPCTVKGNLDEAKNNWSLFADSFVYLYADRDRPRGKYGSSGKGRLDSRLGDVTANKAAFLLAREINDNKSIAIEQLKHQKAKDASVLRNVSAWIGYIMGEDVEVTAKEVEKDKEAKFEYTIKNKDGEGQVLSPLNMPFGHSYILPIVLAVLTAPKDSLIMIENPESHLHPSAQTRMGEFLSRAANEGIQIIIETHSDHLMNGIRIACRHKIITPDNIEMDLIGRETTDSKEHTRFHIKLNDDGTVVSWVPGFFDEWERALSMFIPE